MRTIAFFPHPNVLVTIKGMRAVKLCSNKNPPVLNYGCRLMQVVLYNGCKTVVVVLTSL